jgi:tetratricopeptide (TPR) repeat protein
MGTATRRGELCWRYSFLAEWISRFDSDADIKLTIDRKTAVLEMAEEKAGVENNAAILTAVRKRLAGVYNEQGQFDKAAQYYGMLVDTASGADRDALLAELLEVRLKSKQFDAVGQMVANRLLEKDLDANDILIARIGKYLGGSQNKNDKALLVKSLGGVGSVAGKTKWQQQLAKWRKQVEPNQPPPIAPAPDANRTATAALPQGKI